MGILKCEVIYTYIYIHTLGCVLFNLMRPSSRFRPHPFVLSCCLSFFLTVSAPTPSSLPSPLSPPSHDPRHPPAPAPSSSPLPPFVSDLKFCLIPICVGSFNSPALFPVNSNGSVCGQGNGVLSGFKFWTFTFHHGEDRNSGVYGL